MKNEVNKVLFIVNKFSGKGYDPDFDGKIIKACEDRNIECSIEFTRARGHATELASAAAKEKSFDWVVAVGGDGTVNEVATGLLFSDIPMGILPKGSGNGLGRHLGVPIKLDKALATLFTSNVIAADSFKLNNKLSLNVSGIGFDGHIANLFGNLKKRGLQGYVKLILKEFFRFKEFKAAISSHGTIVTRDAFVIAIANSSQYGNNARIAPAASICDGLLHINVVKKVPPYRLDFIYSFFKGKVHESAYCSMIETSKMRIESSIPIAFHVDGEPSGVDTVFDIEILPQSLKLLVPHTSLRY